MGTLTIRTDPEVERALEVLTRGGQSRSEAARAAILEAERAHRRPGCGLRPRNCATIPTTSPLPALATEMGAIRAW